GITSAVADTRAGCLVRSRIRVLASGHGFGAPEACAARRAGTAGAESGAGIRWIGAGASSGAARRAVRVVRIAIHVSSLHRWSGETDVAREGPVSMQGRKRAIPANNEQQLRDARSLERTARYRCNVRRPTCAVDGRCAPGAPGRELRACAACTTAEPGIMRRARREPP